MQYLHPPGSSLLAPFSTKDQGEAGLLGKEMSPGAPMVKSMAFGGRPLYISTSAPSLFSCVALDKSLNLSEPRFSHIKYLPGSVDSI